MFNWDWPFLLSWELWLFRRIIQKRIAILISLVPTPLFPLRNLLGFVIWLYSVPRKGPFSGSTCRHFCRSSCHLTAWLLPCHVSVSATARSTFSLGSVPHSILISTVRVCCIRKDLGRGSQCPCWRFLVGQGACTFFVSVHSSVSVH